MFTQNMNRSPSFFSTSHPLALQASSINSARINPSIQIRSLQDSRKPTRRNAPTIFRLNTRTNIWSITRILNMEDRLPRINKRLENITFIILKTLLIDLPFHVRQYGSDNLGSVFETDGQASRMSFVGEESHVVDCSIGSESKTVVVIVAIDIIWITPSQPFVAANMVRFVMIFRTFGELVLSHHSPGQPSSGLPLSEVGIRLGLDASLRSCRQRSNRLLSFRLCGG